MFLSVRLGLGEAAEIILVVGLELLLLSIPFLAAASIAIRIGARSQLAIWITGLSAVALGGYLAFWVYLVSPTLGWIYSVAVLLASTGICIWSWPKLEAQEKAALRGLWRPGALVLSFSLYVSSLGFIYGGLVQPLSVAENRFSHQLPVDNGLPLLFAQALLANRRPIPSPLFIDWTSSDRPPLQTGVVLLASPIAHWGQVIQYQMLSVILQSLFVIGLWLADRGTCPLLPPRGGAESRGSAPMHRPAARPLR